MNPIYFVKERENAKNIRFATEQQKDISFFVQSELQEDISKEYLTQWANRKYAVNKKFLNWVKTVFKEKNFLSFYKFCRYPLPSAKLVNDIIKPQLQRVFNAEDSYFKYSVKGKDIAPEELKSVEFDSDLFDALIYNHNAVIVHDINEKEKRFREIIDINCVIAIECDKHKIERIAYHSELKNEDGSEIHGYTYIDDKEYIFFDKNYNIILQTPHDLEECPAVFVSSENMFTNNNVVKKSIFSYVKNDFEEYVFLKTLQRMTEPNGAIPIVTKLKTNDKSANPQLKVSSKEPLTSLSIGGQNPDLGTTSPNSNTDLQAGTVVSIPVGKDDSGKTDMEVIKNYFQFHYLPVESLKYLNDRIKEIEANIISSVVGDYEEQNQSAKNELQISKSYNRKEDVLRALSDQMTNARQKSDAFTLSLIYGKDKVDVNVFYGYDFFIETQAQLYEQYNKISNPIEKRNIIQRLVQNRNQYDLSMANREKILYKIMPFIDDIDFEKAKEKIDDVTFMFQTRFNYWIAMFEAEYGEIDLFFEALEDEKESTKIIFIINLIKNIIKNEQQQISSNA